MSKFLTLVGLLGSGLFSSSLAHAIPSICETFFSGIDDRFAVVETLDHSDIRRRNTTTQLLNETFSPVLFSLGNEIRKLPESSINDTEIVIHRRQLADPAPVDAAKVYGFTAEYTHYLLRNGSQEPFGHWTRRFSTDVTADNAAAMEKLYKVVRTFTDSRGEAFVKEQAGWSLEAANLLRETFFSHSLDQHVQVGLQSILEALSLLSADPIKGLKAEEIIRQASQPRGRRPSLVVELALTMGPAVLGPMTQENRRIPNPLTLVNGVLEWSPSMLESLALQKARRQERRPLERGLGCPVGRCTREESISSLQAVIDAILLRAEITPHFTSSSKAVEIYKIGKSRDWDKDPEVQKTVETLSNALDLRQRRIGHSHLSYSTGNIKVTGNLFLWKDGGLWLQIAHIQLADVTHGQLSSKVNFEFAKHLYANLIFLEKALRQNPDLPYAKIFAQSLQNPALRTTLVEKLGFTDEETPQLTVNRP